MGAGLCCDADPAGLPIAGAYPPSEQAAAGNPGNPPVTGSTTWLLNWATAGDLVGCDSTFALAAPADRVHRGHQTLGAPRDEIQPVLPRNPKTEAMPVQLLQSCGQHPVEFEHGERVLQQEATSQKQAAAEPWTRFSWQPLQDHQSWPRREQPHPHNRLQQTGKRLASDHTHSRPVLRANLRITPTALSDADKAALDHASQECDPHPSPAASLHRWPHLGRTYRPTVCRTCHSPPQTRRSEPCPTQSYRESARRDLRTPCIASQSPK